MENSEKMYDLIVIGGGASGMMAAARASERGLSVMILEKNKRLGEKLRISGGGRCNITNAEEDLHTLLAQYGEEGQPLYSLFTQFGMKDTFSFFESKGLPLKIEAHKRAFPKTEKAEDVALLLEKCLSEGNVTVRTSLTITDIKVDNDRVSSVKSGRQTFLAKEYVLATGGFSHPETGSTGDGFRWLKTFHHTIADPAPGLVPLAISDPWVSELSGLSLEEAKVSFLVDGISKFSVKGKILFTHFGLSGPLILNNSYKVSNLLHEGTVTASIDLFPKKDHGTLDVELLTIFDAYKNKELKNVLKELLPLGTSKGVVILAESILDVETKVHSVSKEERKKLVHLFKAMPCLVDGLMGFDKAVVADGGLSCGEVDFKTMRSKKISNLFVTGDILDIRRPSGGYSLQLCWSTGFVAGNSVGE